MSSSATLERHPTRTSPTDVARGMRRAPAFEFAPTGDDPLAFSLASPPQFRRGLVRKHDMSLGTLGYPGGDIGSNREEVEEASRADSAGKSLEVDEIKVCDTGPAALAWEPVASTSRTARALPGMPQTLVAESSEVYSFFATDVGEDDCLKDYLSCGEGPALAESGADGFASSPSSPSLNCPRTLHTSSGRLSVRPPHSKLTKGATKFSEVPRGVQESRESTSLMQTTIVKPTASIDQESASQKKGAATEAGVPLSAQLSTLKSAINDIGAPQDGSAGQTFEQVPIPGRAVILETAPPDGAQSANHRQLEPGGQKSSRGPELSQVEPSLTNSNPRRTTLASSGTCPQGGARKNEDVKEEETAALTGKGRARFSDGAHSRHTQS